LAVRFAPDAVEDDLGEPAALRAALLAGSDALEVRNAGWEIAPRHPGTAGAQHVEDGVEDATQWVGARSAVSWQGRERVLQALPLRVSEVAGIRRTHSEQATTLRQMGGFPNTLYG